MAKRPNLTDVNNIYTSAPTINDNNNKIEQAFDNTISRDGSTPNQMEADLDLNSNDLLNVRDIDVGRNFILNGQSLMPNDSALVRNWATNAEDVEVDPENYPGEYSAKHYAAKAEESSQDIQSAVDAVEDALLQADRAQRTPFVILALGQSQVRGNGGSTGGDYRIPDGIYVWDNDMSGNSSTNFIPGTQFKQAAFGEPPLNIRMNTQSDWANNLILQAAKKAWEDGRTPYIIQYSIGGTPIETFLTDDTLSSKGWTRKDGEDLSQFMYPGIKDARDSITGYPGFPVDVVFFVHGDANADELSSEYADKIGALVDELNTAEGNIFNKNKTPFITASVNGYGSRGHKVRRAFYGNAAAQYHVPTMRMVDMQGIPTYDGVHFTGAGMEEAGSRLYGATYSKKELVDAWGSPLPLVADADTGFFHFTTEPNITGGNSKQSPWLPLDFSNKAYSFLDPFQGWMIRKDTGALAVTRLACRYTWPVPTKGKAVVDVTAKSSATATIYAVFHEFDGKGDYLRTKIRWFNGSANHNFNGFVRNMEVSMYPSGTVGMDDQSFSSDARYFTFGLYYGAAGDSGEILWRMNRFDIESTGELGAWVSVSGSRSGNTIYTNDADTDLEVCLSANVSSQQFVQVRPVGGTWINVGRCTANGFNTNNFSVPGRWQYRIAGPVDSIAVWAERLK